MASLPRQRQQKLHRLAHQPVQFRWQHLRAGLDVKLPYIVYRRRQRPQPRLQVCDPLPRFRQMRGRVCQQSRKQLHTAQGLRISCASTAAISASASDFRAASRSHATRFCSVISRTIQTVSPVPLACSLMLPRSMPMERLPETPLTNVSCSPRKLSARISAIAAANAAGTQRRCPLDRSASSSSRRRASGFMICSAPLRAHH
jgi:hypothetical protein